MALHPSYVDLQDLKDYLKITDTNDDAALTLDAAAASRDVDTHTHRQFGKTDTPQVRTYTSRYDYSRCAWVADTDDFIGTVVVTVDGVAVDYTAEPVNAPLDGRPYTRVVVTSCGSVAVSGTFGWAAVPDAVFKATLMQAARDYMRRSATFGVVGSPDLSSEVRLSTKLDPDVRLHLASYVRPGAVF